MFIHKDHAHSDGNHVVASDNIPSRSVVPIHNHVVMELHWLKRR